MPAHALWVPSVVFEGVHCRREATRPSEKSYESRITLVAVGEGVTNLITMAPTFDQIMVRVHLDRPRDLLEAASTQFEVDEGPAGIAEQEVDRGADLNVAQPGNGTLNRTRPEEFRAIKYAVNPSAPESITG